MSRLMSCFIASMIVLAFGLPVQTAGAQGAAIQLKRIDTADGAHKGANQCHGSNGLIQANAWDSDERITTDRHVITTAYHATSIDDSGDADKAVSDASSEAEAEWKSTGSLARGASTSNWITQASESSSSASADANDMMGSAATATVDCRTDTAMEYEPVPADGHDGKRYTLQVDFAVSVSSTNAGSIPIGMVARAGVNIGDALDRTFINVRHKGGGVFELTGTLPRHTDDDINNPGRPVSLSETLPFGKDIQADLVIRQTDKIVVYTRTVNKIKATEANGPAAIGVGAGGGAAPPDAEADLDIEITIEVRLRDLDGDS